MRKVLLARNRQADKEELYLENPSGIVTEEDRRMRTFKMIKMASNDANGGSPTLQGNFQQLQKMNDHNPAMIFDYHGRLLRWKKSQPKRYNPPSETSSCCGCTKLTPRERQEEDLYFIE